MRRRRSSADQADEVEIEDRRKAEGTIRESQYKLRQIIDTVPGIVWATGPDGENTYANQRLLDYIGVPHKDFSATAKEYRPSSSAVARHSAIFHSLSDWHASGAPSRRQPYARH
jgi:PAS domain-containing protein